MKTSLLSFMSNYLRRLLYDRARWMNESWKLSINRVICKLTGEAFTVAVFCNCGLGTTDNWRLHCILLFFSYAQYSLTFSLVVALSLLQKMWTYELASSSTYLPNLTYCISIELNQRLTTRATIVISKFGGRLYFCHYQCHILFQLRPSFTIFTLESFGPWRQCYSTTYMRHRFAFIVVSNSILLNSGCVALM